MKGIDSCCNCWKPTLLVAPLLSIRTYRVYSFNFGRFLKLSKDYLPRSHDQKIILKERTQPISTRPYRYPYYHKAKIAKIFFKFMQSGVIRPTFNPFSSFILLVRKACGRWRLCVDCRSLNQKIVKTKFSIPVIDELLDELHVNCVPKLGFEVGLSQDHICSRRCPKKAFRHMRVIISFLWFL